MLCVVLIYKLYNSHKTLDVEEYWFFQLRTSTLNNVKINQKIDGDLLECSANFTQLKRPYCVCNLKY